MAPKRARHPKEDEKMKKLFFALFVIVALLVVAMPVAAQGPDPYIPVRAWYNRTAEMSATWVGDPFGGNPRLGIEVKYEPDGKGGVKATSFNASWPYAGIVAKFGPSPFGPYALNPVGNILPGGIPSSMSGDGSGPRKAIYIGGAWADSAVNPASCYGVPATYANVECRGRNENPYEIPACATVKIPAGTTKWFKLDTWTKDNADNKLRTQIWLDDELDGATKPSGSAVFGAANKYMLGTSNWDDWSATAFYGANPQNELEVNGFWMQVYDPDVLQPNYAFPAPNAWIFTLDVSGAGSLRRSCTAAAYAGQPCVPASKGGPSSNAGVSIGVTGYYNFLPDGTWVGSGVKGYGVFNKFQPSHLLWYEGSWDGWVFLRVGNQMLWDGTATVCSYRQGGNTGGGKGWNQW
jgi:hypothetical protein